MADLEARLVVAPGDAVGPAVLLTIGGSRGAQVQLVLSRFSFDTMASAMTSNSTT